MKRLLGSLAFILLASHAYAQDVDFGAFGDAGTLLSPSAPSAPARGAAPAAGRGAAPVVPPPDRLVRLRDALVKAEAPMTKDQEAALNKLLDAEIPTMRRTLQTHGQQMMAARDPNAAGTGAAPSPGGAPPARGVPPAGATPPANPNPTPAAGPPPAATAGQVPPAAAGQVPPAAAGQAQAAAAAQAQAAAAARGGAPGAPPNPALLAALAARGAPPSSRVPAEVLDALEVEMRQMNDALFSKIAAAPALDAKQQSVLNKMSRDQIRSRGGYDALRISMEDAGAPFTPEQLPQVQSLFEEQKKARATLAKESQGTPDAAKLKQLERDTLVKVVGLLVPAQRTALLALLRAQ